MKDPQGKSGPGAKARTKPKKQRVEKKVAPIQTLEDAELRYRCLLESVRSGILILNAQTGKIEDVNSYLLNLLGYSRADLLDRKLAETGILKDEMLGALVLNAQQHESAMRLGRMSLMTKDGRVIPLQQRLQKLWPVLRLSPARPMK